MFTFGLPMVAILLIVQPDVLFSQSGEAHQLDLRAAGAAVLSAVAWTVVVVLGRKYDSAHSHQLQVVFSFSIQTLCVWVPLMALFNAYENSLYDTTHFSLFAYNPYHWDVEFVVMMLVMGALQFFGLVFALLAYRFAEASKLAYFEHVDLLFAYITQVAILDMYRNTNAYSILGFLLMLAVCVAHLLEEVYNYCKVKKGTESHQYESIDNGERL